jgi:hypothetical protein
MVNPISTEIYLNDPVLQARHTVAMTRPEHLHLSSEARQSCC